jgi:hypothetical protein
LDVFFDLATGHDLEVVGDAKVVEFEMPAEPTVDLQVDLQEACAGVALGGLGVYRPVRGEFTILSFVLTRDLVRTGMQHDFLGREFREVVFGFHQDLFVEVDGVFHIAELASAQIEPIPLHALLASGFELPLAELGNERERLRCQHAGQKQGE